MQHETVYHERDKDRACTFTISIAQDDLQIEGNACATDDPEQDRKCEEWIYSELARGNTFAWATVQVSALLDDGRIGHDYLGACSYRGVQDFVTGGYFDDMKDQAYQDARNGS